MKHIAQIGALLGITFAASYVVAQVAVGPYGQYTTQSSHTVPSAGKINTWARTSDGHFFTTNSSGTDTDLSSGGGSGTVTSVVIGNGLSSTQSPLTTTGTMSIDTSITVDKTTAQALSSKTLTSPVINGATSSGSTAIDFSGNSGAFQTSTGSFSINGNATVANGKTMTVIDNNIGPNFLAVAPAVLIQNNTAAGAGSGQWSPIVDISAAGWDTGGASSTVEHMAVQNWVTQGNPITFSLNFLRASGAGNYTNILALTNTGDLVWPARAEGSIDLSAATSGHGSISSGPGGISSNGPLSVASPQVFTLNADNVGTTQAARAVFVNGVSATAGNQKYSPLLELQAQGWSEAVVPGAQSVAVKMGFQTRPVEITSAEPRGELVLWSSIDGVSYAEQFNFTSDGAMSYANGVGAAVSASGKGKLIYNNSSHTFQASTNGGAYADLGGGGVTWPLTNGTSTNTYTYGGSTGATAHAFDTTNAATAADDLIKVSSAGTEKLAVKYAADGVSLQADGTGSFLQIRSTDWRLAKDASNFIGYNYDIASGFEFEIGGTITAEIVATDFGPRADLGITGGTTTKRYTEVHSRHFVPGQSAVPTCAAGTGAGTSGSPTCSILTHGTDTAGTLSVATQTAPAGSAAVVATVTLNTAMGNIPSCTLAAVGSTASLLVPGTVSVAVDPTAGSTTTWVVKSYAATGLGGSTTYTWAYTCFDSSL